jgi:hypothetical protein
MEQGFHRIRKARKVLEEKKQGVKVNRNKMRKMEMGKVRTLRIKEGKDEEGSRAAGTYVPVGGAATAFDCKPTRVLHLI